MALTVLCEMGSAGPAQHRRQCHLLARTEGLFAETAGGVVISALRNLAHTFDPAETIVVYITGNGLKTQDVIRFLQGLRTPLGAGDVVTLLPVLASGAR